MRKTIAESFDEHWIETPGPLDTPCWIWQRATSGNGYGWLRINGKMVLAHRHSYERKAGLVPGKLYILHRCDNPNCVNHRHLFLGTSSDNTQDCITKNRFVNNAGENHGMSKLTESQVLKIRTDNRLHKIIAREHNISRPSVSMIKSRRTWRWLCS